MDNGRHFLRRKPKISFPSFRLSAEGSGEEPHKNARKCFGLPRPSGRAEAFPSAIGAYLVGQSHHARSACEITADFVGNRFELRCIESPTF